MHAILSVLDGRRHDGLKQVLVGLVKGPNAEESFPQSSRALGRWKAP